MPRLTVCPEDAGCPYTHAVMRPFSIVLAVDQKYGIGANNELPWRCKPDLRHLTDITTKTSTSTGAAAAAPATGKAAKINAVVMGRKSYDSLPASIRPMPNRLNIVMTRSADIPEGAAKLSSATTEVIEGGKTALFHQGDLTSVLKELMSNRFLHVERVFVLGGATVYAQVFDAPNLPYLQEVVVTKIHGEYPCDTFFDVDAYMKKSSVNFHLETSREEPSIIEGQPACSIQWWVADNEEEQQYLSLCSTIIKRGAQKGDRTGVGTRSIFGAQMRFSLRDGRIPLLTTKRVFWRGVCEELLWFLRGCTDGNLLRDKGVHIWDGNASRSFLDGRGLTQNREGDLGPVYGFQWRHFGAEYTGCENDDPASMASGGKYEGKGVDQLHEVLHTLRTNPNDRRIIFSAWNPCALNQMALPPCHVFAQFYVSPDRELSCQMYQRSCDMGLGVPFNIASYALLTIMLAKAAGLKCGDFIHTLGDAHVYNNHIEPLEQQQLGRAPRAFPVLFIKTHRATLEEYCLEDFEILDYRPYPAVKMEMAV